MSPDTVSSPEAFAEALYTLSEDKELCRRFAENAKKATQTTFDLENVLQKTLAVYKSIAPDKQEV